MGFLGSFKKVKYFAMSRPSTSDEFADSYVRHSECAAAGVTERYSFF